MHQLAYIRWYSPVKTYKIRYELSLKDGNEPRPETCNVELWNKTFSEEGSDAFIPIHQILGRFISGTYFKKGKKEQDLLAVIPLNNKYTY